MVCFGGTSLDSSTGGLADSTAGWRDDSMDELDEWLLCLDFAFSLSDFIAGTILCIGVVFKSKRSAVKEDLSSLT